MTDFNTSIDAINKAQAEAEAQEAKAEAQEAEAEAQEAKAEAQEAKAEAQEAKAEALAKAEKKEALKQFFLEGRANLVNTIKENIRIFKNKANAYLNEMDDFEHSLSLIEKFNFNKAQAEAEGIRLENLNHLNDKVIDLYNCLIDEEQLNTLREAQNAWDRVAELEEENEELENIKSEKEEYENQLNNIEDYLKDVADDFKSSTIEDIEDAIINAYSEISI